MKIKDGWMMGIRDIITGQKYIKYQHFEIGEENDANNKLKSIIDYLKTLSLEAEFDYAYALHCHPYYGRILH